MSISDPMDEAEPEGYFASISDLMVGVLFVFLLMMTILALNFRDDSAKLDELREQLELAQAQAERDRRQAEAAEAKAQLQLEQNALLRAHLQRAALELEREIASREAARGRMLERLADGLRARQIQFIIDTRSGVLRLSEAVPFDVNKSTLRDTAVNTVNALADVLAQVLPCFATGAPAHKGCGPGDGPILDAVLVEGHTDHQPYAGLTPAQSRAYNDQLSTERALTVFSQILLKQPVLDELNSASHQPLLGVSGYGQRRPLPRAPGMSDAAYFAQNRRIDLRFILSARTSEEIRRLLDEIATLQAGSAP